MWILERRFSTTKIYDGYKSIGPRVSTELINVCTLLRAQHANGIIGKYMEIQIQEQIITVSSSNCK